MPDRRFLGSTAALLIGCVALLAALAYLVHMPEAPEEAESPQRAFRGQFEVAMAALVGASVYRSAKRRRLGERADAIPRRVLEAVGIAFLACLAVTREAPSAMSKTLSRCSATPGP